MNLFSSFPDPFAVGGGDLDPLGRGLGGGGMLMDPRHMGRQPPLGIPSNLPPGILIDYLEILFLKKERDYKSLLHCFILGAVPPGARFDPFGPIPNMPPIRGPRPRGGGFGDPDFDHLPPPGSGGMFM